MLRLRRLSAPAIFALLALVTLTSCAGANAPGDGWDYSSETVGNVTTVRTTAGSRWGEMGRLVEEMSIGVEEGDDAYMFARIGAVWPDDDKILVTDFRLPAVRAFDHDGDFLFQVGRVGQGPGEYERPMAAMILPDGNIAVVEGSKVHLYSGDGTYLEQWTEQESGMMFFGPGTVTMGLDGTVYRRAPITTDREAGSFSFTDMRWGMKPLRAEGPGEILPAPATDYEAPTMQITMGDNIAITSVPFAPQHQWTLLPTGEFVAGVPNEYRFTIYHADGSETAVERYWEPVPVAAGEAELMMRGTRVRINDMTGAMELGDAEIPPTKPAYQSLFGSRDGRILVIRQGQSTLDPACIGANADPETNPADCVESVTYADLFESDGMFTGSFELPAGTQLMSPYIDGDVLWTGHQDELGTVTVKKYRIEPPASATTN